VKGGVVTTKQKTLFSIGIALVILAAFALPRIIAVSTNCGGNTYALNVCRECLAAAELSTADQHAQFDISKLRSIDKTNLANLGRRHRADGADFLIRTNFVWDDPKREIVVVCERLFDNVPQPTIWNLYHRSPAHAVGYSDGTVSLISTQQFTALNLSGFIPLSRLPTNIAPESLQQ
jgi:hypothetical protein